MFYVYLLYSANKDKHYVGQTNDLVKRLGQHNNQEVTSTKYGVPWNVIYYEAYR